MEATTVIRKPLVTEKTTFAASTVNRFAFEVDRRANKQQIKRAVEELYGVRVLSVATQVRKGSLRRNKAGWFRVGNEKRAVVKLHAEDRIELFYVNVFADERNCYGYSNLQTNNARSPKCFGEPAR